MTKRNKQNQSCRFPLGQIVATQGAFETCNQQLLMECLSRHARGDWGDSSDKVANEEALLSGSRILSAYPIDPAKSCLGYGDNCLWIITEADRSATTFLLPDEY